MKKVLVAHPGLQHSHQLALALHEHGILQKFISGIPVVAKDEQLPFYFTNKVKTRIKMVDIPPKLREHPVWIQLLLKIWKYIPCCIKGKTNNNNSKHKVFYLFDWYCSYKVKRLKPDVVVAFENSAFRTFKAAKSIGAVCVLDAPSFHHSISNKVLKFTRDSYVLEIEKRKNDEVELADVIITCSSLAAQSYVDSCASKDKIKTILLGAELPWNMKPILERHETCLKFVFAGSIRRLKSIDEILEACERLNKNNIPFNLRFVGGSERDYISKIKKVKNCEYVGKVSQKELYEIFSQSDCLLLPSKFDSFGMVVAEAMACGTPAIVSTMTGAKEIIEKFPGSGWIINSDENSIYNAMRYCIENSQEVFNSRQSAKQASDMFSWEAYKKRVANVIGAL